MQHLRKVDPDHITYINLHAVNSFTVSAYNDYLSQYISTVQPSLLCYDNYHLMKGADLSDYFLNLALVSQAAQQAGLPFMQIVQGCAWSASWRIPNANELRFLNYTNLAHGSQGISYFAYYTQYPYTGGLNPNPDGTPTSVYTALQSINPQFTAIAEQVQPLKSIGAYHLGDQPPGTMRLPGDCPFISLSGTTNTTYINGEPVKGMVLGVFASDQQPDEIYTLVVNLDYTSSLTTTLAGPATLEVFDPATGTWSSAGGGGSQVTLNILPGGGALVRGRAPGAKSYFENGTASWVTAPRTPRTVTFDNGSGNGRWDTATNWNPNVTPAVGTSLEIGAGRTVLIDSSTAAKYYGATINGGGRVNMTGGTATAVASTSVGDGASGTWNQSGGVTTTGICDVGRSNATGHVNFSGDAHLIQRGEPYNSWYFHLGSDHATQWGVGHMTISDNALVEAALFDIGDASIVGSQASGHLDITDKGMLRIHRMKDDAGKVSAGDLTKNKLLRGWISSGRITAYGGAGTVVVTYNASLDRTELTAIKSR